MKIKHYLCEDVRTETSGKITLVGLCPDDSLFLEIVDIPKQAAKENTEPRYITTMDRVMLMLTISDYVGEVSIQIEILRPDGSQHGRFEDIGKAECFENKCSNVIINLSGFPVPLPGVYVIKTLINNTPYDIPLRIGNLEDIE